MIIVENAPRTLAHAVRLSICLRTGYCTSRMGRTEGGARQLSRNDAEKKRSDGCLLCGVSRTGRMRERLLPPDDRDDFRCVCFEVTSNVDSNHNFPQRRQRTVVTLASRCPSCPPIPTLLIISSKRCRSQSESDIHGSSCHRAEAKPLFRPQPRNVVVKSLCCAFST